MWVVTTVEFCRLFQDVGSNKSILVASWKSVTVLVYIFHICDLNVSIHIYGHTHTHICTHIFEYTHVMYTVINVSETFIADRFDYEVWSKLTQRAQNKNCHTTIDSPLLSFTVNTHTHTAVHTLSLTHTHTHTLKNTHTHALTPTRVVTTPPHPIPAPSASHQQCYWQFRFNCDWKIAVGIQFSSFSLTLRELDWTCYGIPQPALALSLAHSPDSRVGNGLFSTRTSRVLSFCGLSLLDVLLCFSSRRRSQTTRNLNV